MSIPPPPPPQIQTENQEEGKRLKKFLWKKTDSIHGSFWGELNPSSVPLDHEKLLPLLSLTETKVVIESNHFPRQVLKQINPLLHGVNDQRIIHVLDGDIDHVFEGVVDILYHHMNVLNPAIFKGEGETDDLKDVFDIVHKIEERGYDVVCKRVTLCYLYLLAKSGEQHRVNLRSCDAAAKILVDSSSFKNFLWFLLSVSNEDNKFQYKHFSFNAIFDINLKPDVLEFIFKEFNHHYPGNTLLEDIKPWDELESGIHEAKSYLYHLKEKIESIDLYNIQIDGSDPKVSEIYQRFENLKRDIESSIEESSAFGATFQSYFGTEPNYFFLMTRMSGLYHTLHHIAERNNN